jgi:hypothetical protein
VQRVQRGEAGSRSQSLWRDDIETPLNKGPLVFISGNDDIDFAPATYDLSVQGVPEPTTLALSGAVSRPRHDTSAQARSSRFASHCLRRASHPQAIAWAAWRCARLHALIRLLSRICRCPLNNPNSSGASPMGQPSRRSHARNIDHRPTDPNRHSRRVVPIPSRLRQHNHHPRSDGGGGSKPRTASL